MQNVIWCFKYKKYNMVVIWQNVNCQMLVVIKNTNHTIYKWKYYTIIIIHILIQAQYGTIIIF